MGGEKEKEKGEKRNKLLEDLGVQAGNAVDGMRADNGQVRHVDRLFAVPAIINHQDTRD